MSGVLFVLAVAVAVAVASRYPKALALGLTTQPQTGLQPLGYALFDMATIRQKQSTYAITISTFQSRSHFQRDANAGLFIATLFRYRDAGKFLLHGFAVMPDHVHVLITTAAHQSTSRCVQLIKGGYSYAVREQSPGEIWHPGCHEHRIRDQDDFTAQRLYIANNPSRKGFQEYPHVHTAEKYRSLLNT